MELILEVRPTDSPIRLDLLLLEELRKIRPDLSRGRLGRAFSDGLLRTTGGSLLRASDLLPPGHHRIECLDPGTWLDSEEQHARPADSSFLAVIYEDSEVLVLHKESGTPSLPHLSSEARTAVSSALARCPSLRDISGRSPLEPGLIHRLDTGTSGILVFAKTSGEFERLVEAWKRRDVRKTYRARVLGSTDRPVPTTWDHPLAHSAKSAKRMRVLDPQGRRVRESEIRGKPQAALTHLRQIRSGPGNDRRSAEWDLEIEIETGVLHQIRAHLAHAGLPILGDAVYGGPESTRLWLHAWRLELPLASGTRLQLQALLPW